MPDTASHASTRRQARTDGGGGGEKESSVPELCSLQCVFFKQTFVDFDFLVCSHSKFEIFSSQLRLCGSWIEEN